MQLLIEPVDVWLFRDGRSFDAESDHWAKSLFPPFPSVVQGVIRSHHVVVANLGLADLTQIEAMVGTAVEYGSLRLRGPLLMKDEVRYYPAPADARTVDRNNHMLEALKPDELKEGVKTSSPTSLLLVDKTPQKGETGLWLPEEQLKKYLRGEIVAGIPGTELFARESRLGIKRDDARRATIEGYLYEAEFIRPCAGVGLWLEMEGYEGWPEHGLLRMGGEGRAGYFTRLAEKPTPLAGSSEELPLYFKLYFTTPTYFAGGWQPEGGNWSQYFTGPVKLEAAAVGRYQSVGGYDWAKHTHKPAYRYAPAGSVYYFSAADQPVSLRYNWVCDPTPEGAIIGQIGFGQVIAAEWSKQHQ